MWDSATIFPVSSPTLPQFKLGLQPMRSSLLLLNLPLSLLFRRIPTPTLHSAAFLTYIEHSDICKHSLCARHWAKSLIFFNVTVASEIELL